MPRTYHWSIATTHITRHKASAVRLMSAVALCTIVIIATIVVYISYADMVDKHASSVSISLFLRSDVDLKSATDLASDLAKDPVIASVRTLSPDSVRTMFNDRYGVNVSEVLPTNPFPSVLTLQFKPVGLSGDNFINMVQQCRALTTLVEDVSYSSELVKTVMNETKQRRWISIALAGIAALLVLSLLSFALRAERMYSGDDVYVMSMFGAKQSFLRRSVLWFTLMCAVTGAVGGAGICISVLRFGTLVVTTGLENQILFSCGAAALSTIVLSLFICRLSLPKY